MGIISGRSLVPANQPPQVENSVRLVFKPWERRLDKVWRPHYNTWSPALITWSPDLDQVDVVESDADEELLINIPFTGDVKLKGIIVIGGEEDTHPDKVLHLLSTPAFIFTCTSSPLSPASSPARCVCSRIGKT